MLTYILFLKRKLFNLILKFRSDTYIFFLKKKGYKIGDRVYIGPKSNISGRNITIGNNTTIVAEAKISEDVQIGSNVVIASGCYILTKNHDVGLCHNALPYGTNYDNRPVIIANNVWIGMNVTIIPGITINEGAIIGMGAVVTKDVGKCEIFGGNPAKKIGARDSLRYEFLKEHNCFLNDIRGKNYLSNKITKKINQIISEKSITKKIIYDYELYPEPYKVRSVMYNYSLNHNFKFDIDNKGYFIESK